MILRRVVAFAESLRSNGVRVSPDEVADAARAIAALGGEGLLEREGLRAALAATLVKSTGEQTLFDRLFDLHFVFALQGGPLGARALHDALVARGVDAERAHELLASLHEHGEVIAALAAGDDERLTEAIRAALTTTDLSGLRSPLQVAYFASRLMTRLGVDDVERALHGLADGGGDEAERRAVRGAVDESLQVLRRAARRAIEAEHEKNDLARAVRARARAVEDAPFAQIPPHEIARTKDLVDKLARRLKARVRRREKAARRGRVDPRRTLRANVGTDSIPVRVRFLRRRRERPDVVVLCDVSDSVRAASVFMLAFVWSLADLFRRVRCFVFVDRIADATDVFRGARLEDAIGDVLHGVVVNVSANSDYGTSLRQFRERYMGTLSRRTTVVILGDGRSNYRPPEAWVVEEMRARARRVLWFATEERGTWGFGDSEMRAYARYADAIRVVRNLSDLARAVDRLVL